MTRRLAASPDDIWSAVKRMETAARRCEAVAETIHEETNKLRRQLLQANKVIALLVREREDPKLERTKF